MSACSNRWINMPASSIGGKGRPKRMTGGKGVRNISQAEEGRRMNLGKDEDKIYHSSDMSLVICPRRSGRWY